MNKEELKIKFEKNVCYLQRNIPPDDIYVFAEQTLMAAMFFLSKWNKHVDINDECNKDSVTKKWVNNIMGLYQIREQNIDLSLDLDLTSVEEDENNY